jgi:hypothetical protein
VADGAFTAVRKNPPSVTMPVTKSSKTTSPSTSTTMRGAYPQSSCVIRMPSTISGRLLSITAA